MSEREVEEEIVWVRAWVRVRRTEFCIEGSPYSLFVSCEEQTWSSLRLLRPRPAKTKTETKAKTKTETETKINTNRPKPDQGQG